MVKKWKEYNTLPKAIKKTIKPLNDLEGSEWVGLSKSVNFFNGGIAQKRKEHGAAFPTSLAKHFIKIYTKKGDCVFDPFVGVGTTLDASELLGRNSIGMEINKKFIELAESGIDSVDCSDNDEIFDVEKKVIFDDCLNLKKYVKKESVDLILTSPPYSDLLNNTIEVFGGADYEKNIYKNAQRQLAKPYSKDECDFGNMDWAEYCKRTEELMEKLYEISSPGSYNVWVVKDFRRMEEKTPYVNLHGKIIELATKADWVLFDIMIWDQTDQRKLVKLGGPKCRRFYLNIGHSFILIFRKNIPGEDFTNG